MAGNSSGTRRGCGGVPATRWLGNRYILVVVVDDEVVRAVWCKGALPLAQSRGPLRERKSHRPSTSDGFIRVSRRSTGGLGRRTGSTCRVGRWGTVVPWARGVQPCDRVAAALFDRLPRWRSWPSVSNQRRLCCPRLPRRRLHDWRCRGSGECVRARTGKTGRWRGRGRGCGLLFRDRRHQRATRRPDSSSAAQLMLPLDAWRERERATLKSCGRLFGGRWMSGWMSGWQPMGG